MNPPSFAQKHYPSARHRFLQPSIQRFLQTQCPKVFGPLLAQHLAEKIVQLVEKQLPPQRPSATRPGGLECRLGGLSPR